ncbi:nitrogen fixation protein NifQ [Rhabdochromatium marinum]|uniref:nitrogen fixation protein NifQ n=1 Tax=Rhabdochromatium marinum TaxID=48729 RepID=UPI001907E68C|nr:nitrogen fixation protein NifQ [Rhabdochromatium marinum]MBK1649134.1 hydrogenase [Rhabdochromatium marinum]
MWLSGSGLVTRETWRGFPEQGSSGVGWLPDTWSLFQRLIGCAAGRENDLPLACMIASRCSGLGVLPDWLGLESAAFGCLMRWHFPGVELGGEVATGARLAPDRAEEVADLVRILLMDKAGNSPSEVWMAHILAAGCCGDDHLWQDLGLLRRTDLTALMQANFPALAARNVKDMKWKRFLYKQLCVAEGLYSCRAPSCNQCIDYHACFGPES